MPKWSLLLVIPTHSEKAGVGFGINNTGKHEFRHAYFTPGEKVDSRILSVTESYSMATKRSKETTVNTSSMTSSGSRVARTP
jgi:hypothetical protein